MDFKESSIFTIQPLQGSETGVPVLEEDVVRSDSEREETPKYLGYLNTLHPNPRDEFKTCWGCVEELLGAGELWIDHKKDIFFPFSSAAACINHPLEVDQRRRPRT
ncbi:hypothetical protein Taro_005552 [Colocasia esculenta]|uniref:Uncharacterized protein n=1 Tax=Colocasia esculenta TaxID=4460 RepID=A0A843TQ85_COLES|nr:hypothetical protein [Colocasia esculenta]